MSNIPSTTLQFGRKFSLLVSNSAGKTIDLSNLRVKFAVKKTAYRTANTADILVYNLSTEQAVFIKGEFTNVIMQGGYAGNYGTLFKGNIVQAIIGRENATDTFINLICGDGDQALNFTILKQTIGSSASGASPANQLDAAINAFGQLGVRAPVIGTPLPQVKLPRGKTLYGTAKDYVQAIAETNGYTWSVQDEKMVFIPEGSFLPGQPVIITSKTGMIGTPQQTTEGVKVKCLLNPKIGCHSLIQIDNRSVQQYKIDLTQVGSAANTPVPLSSDGVYYVLLMDLTGDTRGKEWYSNITSLYKNATNNPLESVGSL